jgi:hypothetical protein
LITATPPSPSRLDFEFTRVSWEVPGNCWLCGVAGELKLI